MGKNHLCNRPPRFPTCTPKGAPSQQCHWVMGALGLPPLLSGQEAKQPPAGFGWEGAPHRPPALPPQTSPNENKLVPAAAQEEEEKKEEEAPSRQAAERGARRRGVRDRPHPPADAAAAGEVRIPPVLGWLRVPHGWGAVARAGHSPRRGTWVGLEDAVAGQHLNCDFPERLGSRGGSVVSGQAKQERDVGPRAGDGYRNRPFSCHRFRLCSASLLPQLLIISAH